MARLSVDFPSSFADLLELLKTRLLHKSDKKLVAFVLANPSNPFARDHVLPAVPYWHFRSGDAILIVFFGFLKPPFSPTDETAKVDPLQFSAKGFVEAIEAIEKATSVEYSGRTMMILTAAERRGAEQPALNYEWVLDFDIEGLIKDGAIEDVRVLFEDVIRLAKAHPADDALWAIGEGLSDEGKNEAFMGIAERYIPFLKNAREVAKAHTRFRVRDRRPAA